MVLRRNVTLRTVALSLLVFAGLALASATEDSYIAGYASAVLERELDVESATITVKDGVVTLIAEELPAHSRDKVVSALSAIPGVVRVEIASQAEAGASSRPASASREGGTTSARVGRPRFVFLSFQEPLFRPLRADPRSPHFSVAYHNYIDDPELEAVGARASATPFRSCVAIFPPGSGRSAFRRRSSGSSTSTPIRRT